MSKPYISVVMAAKNRENFIGKTIESYLKQTYQDFEIVVVNDHSSDGTLKISKSFANEHNNIRVFDMPKNKTGVSSARDYGIMKAQGEIIAIGDSDDWAEPDRLKIIEKVFKNKKCDCFYSNCKLHYNASGRTITRPFQPFNRNLILSVNFIANSAAAFRKSAYQKVGGYNEDLKIGEDYDLWLKFVENNLNFYSYEKPLVTIFIHKSSLRAKNRQNAKKNITLIRKLHNLPKPKQEDVQNLAESKFWKYLATPGGLNLWF